MADEQQTLRVAAPETLGGPFMMLANTNSAWSASCHQRCQGQLKSYINSVHRHTSEPRAGLKMLIFHPLLIFALTSSVVALPPHQPFSTAWQTLQGHTDIRLFDVPNPEEPSLIYRWYRLKIGDVPTWPEDAVLEQVMQFAATDHRVSRVTYLKLKRVVENDGHEFHLQGGYEEISSGDVNDPKIPLEGFWGRADKLDVSNDFFWKPSVVEPRLQTLTTGKARRAIIYDEVIKVRTIEGVRQIQFLEYDKVPCEHCYPALTVYELTKGKSTPPVRACIPLTVRVRVGSASRQQRSTPAPGHRPA